MIFTKGDQRVDVADGDAQLVAYYRGEGFTEVPAGDVLPLPARSANKPDWVAYVAQEHPELPEDEVGEMTVTELQRVSGVTDA